MADAATGPDKRRRHPLAWWLVGLGVAALIVWGGVAAWRAFRPGAVGGDTALPPLPPDPRDTTDSPYRNVRPGVKYVGSAACADCHADVTARYAGHPMGRSLAVAGPDVGPEAGATSRFAAQGFEYAVERKGDHVIHRETRKDADGAILWDVSRTVSHAIGSGTRGKTYIWEREGRVFESPISWYTGPGRWNLSPGYEQRNQHFDRPITPDCLFCHANQVTPVEHTVNQYQPPLFRGHAIGCERCHGPGELHVDRGPQKAGEKFDPTIVNPTKLPGHLRDAVCEQCHLQGEHRVPRLGRSLFDYRPGLRLEDFVVHFVRAKHLVDYSRSVGQVEQMRVSRCYVGSGGKLGCVSCHDPHETPAPAQKVAFYRGRCQQCHEPGVRDCRLPRAERDGAGRANDCVQCHMPRGDSTSIVHASVTDHRVLRRPGSEPTKRREPLGVDESPLRPFRDVPARRETGVALARLAAAHDLWPPARLAVPLLTEAVEEYPQDADALEGLVNAHWLLGQSAEARGRLDQLVRHAPRSETARVLAARFLLPRWPDEAQAHGERLLAINPHLSENHLLLGLALQAQKQWPRAIQALEEALRLSPSRLDARRSLIYCLAQEREWERAERELRAYAALGAPDVEAVRGWLKR